MYEQLKTPNLDPVVYVNGKILYDWFGWCLAVSETMFGVPRLYANAWEGWNATKSKHKDRNFPKGVYIPIWFDGKWNGQRYGHVAIYKDGKIWSSPYTHKATADTFTSIEAVEKIYGMTFVGWSDDIAGVYVIKKKEVQDVLGDLFTSIKPLSEGNVVFKVNKDTSRWDIPTTVSGKAKATAVLKKGHVTTCQAFIDIKRSNGKTDRYYINLYDLTRGRLWGVNKVDVTIVHTYKAGSNAHI